MIFDVGANRGQTALAYLKRFPDAELVAFEANPALLGDLSSLGLRVIHCAVGDPPPQKAAPHLCPFM